MNLKILDELTATVRLVSIDQARDPSAQQCECHHLVGMHEGGVGRCRGKRCKGGVCTKFRGVRWSKVWEYRRFARVLLYALGMEIPQEKQRRGKL